MHSERMLCETWQGFTRLCTNLKWQDSGSCRRTAKPCEHMPTSVRTLLSRGTIGWDSDFDLCEAGEAHIFRNFNPGTAVWQQVLLQVDGKSSAYDCFSSSATPPKHFETSMNSNQQWRSRQVKLGNFKQFKPCHFFETPDNDNFEAKLTQQISQLVWHRTEPKSHRSRTPRA